MKKLMTWPTAGLATMALMVAVLLALNTSSPGATHVAAAEPCSSSVKINVASSILSQVPIGVNVTHKARVRSYACPEDSLEGVTLTFVPAGGQSLVTTGNTGAWSCTANADQSLTCTRPSLPTGILVSTLTFTYQQGPYQDGNGRASACVTVASPSYGACSAAYSTSLP